MNEVSKRQLKVLLVEDSEDDALLVIDELRQGGYEPEWKRVQTPEELRQALSEVGWDLILADYKLPRLTGLDAFAIYAEFGLDVPFIIISGTIGEDIAVAAMKAGVHDYLTKGNLARLIPAVERELREAVERRERRRAEAALRDQIRLVNLSHDAIITMDADRRITGWNAGADEMYAYTEAEARGQRIHDFLKTSTEGTAAEIDAILYRDGRWEGELNHVARNGNRLRVESRQVLLRDKDGRPVKVLEINRDITNLRASEERYRKLFESMQEAFVLGEIILDAAGLPSDWRYLDVNPAFERMFGRTRGEVIGGTFRNLFPDAPWEYWVSAMGEVALEGKAAHLDRYGHYMGRHYEAMVYSPQKGQFAAVFADITERKVSEERLRQAQKMESVGLLAGGVAHDFNNLLTVILGTASLGLEECPTCEHSKAILSAAERAAQLTKQLLAYAGKGQFIKKAVDMSDLVSGSRELLAASVPKRVDLVFHIAGGLPTVEEDPSRIEQILMNLVINAAEAIPPNSDGRIEIGTGTSEIMPEEASGKPRYVIAPGRYVCLEVRDSGAGMDETTLSRIFDPFYTTKFTGRGLGLAAVDGIVRSSGGFIDVSSTRGTGSAFRVFLPASEKTPVTEFDKSRQPLQHRNLSTILVVDDEKMVRNVASMILGRHGYEVVEAVNGKDALRVLADSRVPPSLALVDLAMPVMGGEELVPILAKQYPRLKIVISSGFPEEVARNEAFGDKVVGFVQKPYTATTLADRIDEILGEGGPRQDSKLVQFPKFG